MNINSIKNLFLTATASVLLASCAQPTYQKQGPAGTLGPGIGYSDSELGDGHYFVSYTGGFEDDQAMVSAYLDRRIKEVGQEKCGGNFTIFDRASKSGQITRGAGVYATRWEEVAIIGCD